MNKLSSTSASKRIESQTVCPICGGAGFLRRDVPLDHPDFGKAIPCDCKLRELQKSDLDGIRKNSGHVHLTQMTFSSFQTDSFYLSPDKQSNLRWAKERAQQFTQEAKGWMLLKGGYGAGKTHLAAAIANERVAKGEPVLFVVVPDLLDHLRATFSLTSEVTYDDRFEAIRSTPFLILDDFGTENATPWAEEKLFQLLNFRYTAELPTVITTNQELSGIDPRISSRFGDERLCTIVAIFAPDYRQGGAVHDELRISSLELYRDMTFDTFNMHRQGLSNEQRENMSQVYANARKYARDRKGFFILTGDYGSGKTHLAAAIANEIEEDHKQHGQSGVVLFVVVPDLLDHLRATFAPGSPVSYDRLFVETRSASYLVLDDLGTENSTPWAREKLFQIIDHRYVADLPTIITIYKKTQIDPRIRARIDDQRRSWFNEIVAPSFRTTHRQPQAKADNTSRKRQSYR